MIYVKNIFDKDNIHKYLNLNHLFKDDYITHTSGNKKYIEPVLHDSDEYKYNVSALLLRSATLSFEGVISLDDTNNNYSLGSSLAAPKIARVAYELKKKYPFLRYNQIKQILLSTAKRDDSGYLSNSVGWGYLDKDKALKGISDLNAGLIEEEKFFAGMPDRIYDKDKNIYAYFDIDSGEYTFSNDITSGLKGDGNTKKSGLLKLKGSYDQDWDRKDYTIRLPKVLDSERNYYANVKRAGLRKDGSGTLILEGKQDYERTQVLGGKLVLKNDSKSKYEIFEKAELKIDKNNVNIENNIINSGTVDFNYNSKIKEYFSNNDSVTKIKHNIKIKADKFYSLGKLYIDFENSKEKVREVVESSDIKLKGIENKYLTKPEIKDNKLIVLKEVDEKHLKDLDNTTLRNIPSYNMNEKDFFKEFKNKETTNRFRNDLLSINTKTETSEIFTDMYPSYISNLFEINEDVINNVKNKNNISLDKNNAFYYNSYLSTHLFKDKKFMPFKSNLIGNSLGYERKINDNIIGDVWFGIYNGELKFSKDEKIRNDNYQVGLALKYNNKISLENYLSYNYVNSKLDRKIEKKAINSEFNTHLISNTLSLFKKFDLNDKVKIKPEINYTLMYLNLNKVKEKSESSLTYDLNNNQIFKNILGASLEIENIFSDKFKLRNKISYNRFLNDEVKLNTKMDNINFSLIGKKIEKNIFRYNIEGEYKPLDNLKLNFNLGIKNINKIGLSSTIKYEF